ncbi:hypothetical protein [Parapedobacter sp.]
MRKITLLAIIFTLLLGSCGKEKNAIQPEETKQEMVVVNGVEYAVDSLERKLSIMTGISVERLYFVAEKAAFYDTEYDYEFKLSVYIESLNTIK